MAVIVRYHRHTVLEEQEMDSIEDAVRFLAVGEEAGELTSRLSEIRADERIITGDELAVLVDRAWDQLQSMSRAS